MPPAPEPALSLAEWIVLSVVCEGSPVHGHAVVAALGRDGELGRVWYVYKAVVYRSLERLTKRGLLRPAGEEETSQGPVRLLVDATERGRTAALAWQRRPVEHTRDIRSELLVKLALLHRSGVDPGDLLAAQRARLLPVAAALQTRLADTTGFERTLLLWRYATTSATLRFLDELLAASPESASA